MNNDLITVTAQLAELLNKHGVKYVLVGGIAVALHGVPRHTEDIDLLVETSPSNIERLKRALFEYYTDESVWEISEDDVKYQVVRYGTPGGYCVDIIFSIETFADYSTVEEYFDILELHGVPVRILSPEGLIFLKSGTLREIDHYDAEMLKALMESEKQESREPVR